MLPRANEGAGEWLHLMAVVDEWCMVRHPRCIPFAIRLAEWEAMPTTPPAPRARAAATRDPG